MVESKKTEATGKPAASSAKPSTKTTAAAKTTKTAASAATAASKAKPQKAGEKPASAKTATAKAATTKTEPAKAAKQPAASKAETAKATAAKTATEPAGTAKAATATDQPAKAAVASKQQATKKAPAAKTAAAKTAAAKAETKKSASQSKAASTKTAAAKTTASKTAASKATAAKATTAKPAATKTTASKTAAAKPAATKATSAKPAATKVAAEEKKAAAIKAETAAGKTAKASSDAKKAVAKKTTPAKATEDPKKADAAKATEEPKKAAAAKATEEPKKAASAQQEKPAVTVDVAKKEAIAKEQDEKAPAAVAEVAQDIVAQAAKVAPEFADVPGVLIAAAECSPLVKVGGLADIVGALPKYLKKLGIDARVIMPFHRQVKERYYNQVQHLCDFQASLGWRSQYVGLEKLELDGVTYYFIDNEFYFGGPIYCGGEFEGEQYAFFTRAVMDVIPQLDYEVRILHCNDWHTAMMPLLAKTQYHGGMQEGLRTLLTIHNLHFQGQFSHEFDRDLLRVDDSLATPQFIEHYGCDNMLKAGIVFSDKVNTVSPTYAHEICEPYGGESLEGVLRSRGADLSGILNGIDVDVWNPETDDRLPARFSATDLEGKRIVRDELLQELGLEPAGEYTAVIAMVTRLVPQKGIDLVNAVIDELMGEDVRVIVLGSGYPEYEEYLRYAEDRHKGRLCSYIGYNGDLSHRIYAGSDLFLMPSQFEPCGVSQMIAMRYGTLPIVRETGGLKDTVTPYNEYTGQGNGFSFANYDAGEMLNVVRYALWVWRGEGARQRLITQSMETDFSFDRAARSYAELYRSLL